MLDAIEKNDSSFLTAPPCSEIQEWRSQKHKASLLHHYARHGIPDATTLEWFLSSGLDINTLDGAGNVPLHCIFEQSPDRSIEWARLLLERGANPNMVNSKHETPLVLAVKQRNFDLVDTFLKEGAFKWQPGWPEKACFDNEIVHAMGKVHAQRTIDIALRIEQVHPSTLEGKTHGLFAALGIGAWELAKFYIQQGANPLARNMDHETTLHAIARHIGFYRKASKEHVDIVRYMASLGVDPALTNKAGLKSSSYLSFPAVKSAFDLAAANGNADYIKQQSSTFRGRKSPGRRI